MARAFNCGSRDAGETRSHPRRIPAVARLLMELSSPTTSRVIQMLREFLSRRYRTDRACHAYNNATMSPARACNSRGRETDSRLTLRGNASTRERQRGIQLAFINDANAL